MDDENLFAVCLDASVVLKFLIHEDDSDKTSSLFKKIFLEKEKIIEPHFLKIEVYSSLQKKFHFHELSERQVRKGLNFFERLDVNYFVEDKEILKLSSQLTKTLNQPVIYDALYLALAIRKKAVFITADIKFLKEAKKIYKNSFSLKSFSDGQKI